ncbi:cytochrome c oxidase subunit NDUFA4-like [Paramacrobiotus metropolitanus]|uniref:cytochrome c oxidase subunit NDUFA4-like n=1 Tax=Paramacrobiotus metropolitanus TaxID=2943436 RepID=UPI0024458B29|nr:cytochrome c oxidase subunit NDUFA4-like [Paramacrobiotus metropolitanus]XP_055354035.1 cytochrome c oxidase subunit NDUFA4-like [Paramacrobiotus metropolitanus]
MVMQGLTWKSLKKNPSLMPLFFFVGAGSVMALVYVIRLATRHPEVTWTRANKNRPWDAYADNKQYKLWSDTIDYKNLPPIPAPKLD